MMTNRPKAFISYSHQDREIAARIAEGLMKNGIDTWFDRWEIAPGDSLIKKIFEEGLSKSDVFLILLSNNSINSNWVQAELDTAMVRRISGITRVIPVIIEDVPLPESLRSIKYELVSENFEESLRNLTNAIFGIYNKPVLGQPPEVVKNSLKSVGGLTPMASGLGLFFLTTGDHDLGNEETFTAAELSERLGYSPQEIDDAIDELEDSGMVKTLNFFGTQPFSHGDVTPTYVLFLHFKDNGLQYDPEEDIKIIASAIAAQKQTDGNGLFELTTLSPLRINRAVAYLGDYGITRVFHEMGTAPYDFGFISATGATRRFVNEHCN